MVTGHQTNHRDLHYASSTEELAGIITSLVPSDTVFTHGHIAASKQDGSLMGYTWFPFDVGKDICAPLINPLTPAGLSDFLASMDPLIMPCAPFGFTGHRRMWQVEHFHADGEGHSLNTIVKYIPDKHSLN